ncbi:MAG: phosphate/phosphite/phosphonate ABC transporter substrate-binding protein [Alphaproteobacteria bacterium]|nr:phosphate/phosphite/phosphonate ABC transporter substrate-binding protein [Alphaproteobacteria bacterium]
MNLTRSILIACATLASAVSWGQACPHRGELDTAYCDADRDLVADLPTDKSKWRDPGTLIFAYGPTEDPATYEGVLRPFVEYLSQCTAKPVRHFALHSHAAEIEAMRAGRLHVAGYAAGPTGFAVNLAGAVPFAAPGTEAGIRGYHLAFIVRADSPYRTLPDLKGKKVAHVAPSSNSGHLAPLALFPAEGLTPGQDYKPSMSGGHDKSALGVVAGDYDGAPVASGVLERMIARGTFKADAIRTIHRSANFPTQSFAHAHDLRPELAAKIKHCMFAFRFPPLMSKEFSGDDRFLPIDYKKDWEPIRRVAEVAGTPFNRAGLDREAKREAEEREKAKR